jgi:hypothetical protein
MNKPIKLTNEQMRPGHEVEQHLREYGHLPDTGCCGLETNFIEEQQKEARKKLTSPEKVVRDALGKTTDAIVTQTITNTLNHILESGLLENKPMTVFSFVLKGEELEQYMRHRGHNQAVEAVKEFMSNMDKK